MCDIRRVSTASGATRLVHLWAGLVPHGPPLKRGNISCRSRPTSSSSGLDFLQARLNSREPVLAMDLRAACRDSASRCKGQEVSSYMQQIGQISRQRAARGGRQVEPIGRWLSTELVLLSPSLLCTHGRISTTRQTVTLESYSCRTHSSSGLR